MAWRRNSYGVHADVHGRPESMLIQMDAFEHLYLGIETAGDVVPAPKLVRRMMATVLEVGIDVEGIDQRPNNIDFVAVPLQHKDQGRLPSISHRQHFTWALVLFAVM